MTKEQVDYTHLWQSYLSGANAEEPASSLLDCCCSMTRCGGALSEREVGSLHFLLQMLDAANGAAVRWRHRATPAAAT